MNKDQPIGVLDSGVGGLAVVASLKACLPGESIYYVGDTAHLPYGDKSTSQIQGYIHKIGTLLLKQNCKVVVIACATATTAAGVLLQQQMGPTIPVINVIDPLITYLHQGYAGKQLGLIATPYTIAMGIYTQKLQAVGATIALQCLATPLLAPAIEADMETDMLLERYLSHSTLQGIQGLILGCTHYWLIQAKIAAYYRPSIPIISGAAVVAQCVQRLLMKKKLLYLGEASVNRDVFVVTKMTAGFEAMAKRLFISPVVVTITP